jgi:hypothetical protein
LSWNLEGIKAFFLVIEIIIGLYCRQALKRIEFWAFLVQSSICIYIQVANVSPLQLIPVKAQPSWSLRRWLERTAVAVPAEASSLAVCVQLGTFGRIRCPRSFWIEGELLAEYFVFRTNPSVDRFLIFKLIRISVDAPNAVKK